MTMSLFAAFYEQKGMDQTFGFQIASLSTISIINPQRMCKGYSSQLCLCVCVCVCVTTTPRPAWIAMLQFSLNDV